MTDEGHVPDTSVPFARTYDYFKYMTGITLLSIGGVFAFLKGDGVVLDVKRVIVILVALVISGVSSLLMAAYLAGLEVKPVSRDVLVRRIKFGGWVSTAFLSIGLGAFIQTFGSAILK